jgi:hypothetical protein
MGRYDVLLQQDRSKEAQEPVDAPQPKTPPPSSQAPAPLPKRTSEASSPQREPGTPRPTKRGFVRRSFDFYEDQVSYLTKVSLQERLAGGEGSMNAMVREAVDDYIKKRSSRK